jgi:hypothetical protein
LKKDIKPIDESIKLIKKIRGVSFFWVKDANVQDITKRDIGFVAQELKIALPEVVVGEEPNYLIVKYQDIVALCIEAIKEQSIRLEKSLEVLDKLELIAKEKGLS